jgi:hypothetical protein
VRKAEAVALVWGKKTVYATYAWWALWTDLMPNQTLIAITGFGFVSLC